MPLNRLVDSIRDSFEEVVLERVTRPKYEDAERIALNVLDKRIDTLEAKPKATQKDIEQMNLLKGIKAEIQRDLDERWQNREVGAWANRRK
ncbi:hypothetical protein ACI8AA_01115 [Geodermatophilus sp. SYSU D01180]